MNKFKKLTIQVSSQMKHWLLSTNLNLIHKKVKDIKVIDFVLQMMVEFLVWMKMEIA